MIQLPIPALQHWSQTQFLEGHTCLEVSSDPEELDYLNQVCLIRVGAKLCRAVALQELSLRTMLYMILHYHKQSDHKATEE